MSNNLEGKLVHVFNSHGIGDVIMSLPMLYVLLNEGARILLTVKGRPEAAVVNCTVGKQFDDRIDFIYFSEFVGLEGAWRYLKLIRNYKLDISISASGIHKDKYNIMAFLSGAPKRIGLGGKLSYLNHVNLTKQVATHKVQKNLEIIDGSFDLNLDIENIKLPVYRANKFTIRDVRSPKHGKLIAFAPSSGELEAHKRWPLDSFRELAKRLVSKGHMVVVLGGPGEEELGDYIIRGLGENKVRNYIGKLTISESLDCLHHCDVLVANCNGLSHMGSLIPKLHLIGLFGPTNPLITGPYRSDLIPLSAGLDCSPCYRRGYIQGCGEPTCMKDIDVSLVESFIG